MQQSLGHAPKTRIRSLTTPPSLTSTWRASVMPPRTRGRGLSRLEGLASSHGCIAAISRLLQKPPVCCPPFRAWLAEPILCGWPGETLPHSRRFDARQHATLKLIYARCTRPERHQLIASSSRSSPQKSSLPTVNVGEPKMPNSRAASVSDVRSAFAS
jgi:hypothetical protein